MDDFEKNKSAEPNGFDNTDSGYTVTPEGGFYNKQKNDIIQDNANIPPAGNHGNNGYQPYSYPNNTNQSYGYNNYSYSPPPRPKKVKEPKRYPAWVVIIAAVMAGVISAVIGVAGTNLISKYDADITRSETSQTETVTVPGNNVSINIDKTVESVVEAVAEKVTPSVVGIRTTTSVTSFFGGSSESSGEGSGVVYSSDGYIITNYHVIKEAISNKSGSKIEVFLDSSDAEAHTATVVGYNISSDLAVIKINVSGLTAVEIANSSELKVGQYVITVGNPGGLEFMDSVTYGVISGIDRLVSADSGVKLIQTDAAINPGNSGGALVNTKGQLVGINSAKRVSEQFEGMGFAIPSNTVVEICKKIIEKENSPEPYIGISISERYTAEALRELGYPEGAVVLSVADGSPAKTAGIKKGDIITEFNGTKITEYQVLEQLMENCKPDEKFNVKIYRGGRYYTTSIEIGSNNQLD